MDGVLELEALDAKWIVSRPTLLPRFQTRGNVKPLVGLTNIGLSLLCASHGPVLRQEVCGTTLMKVKSHWRVAVVNLSPLPQGLICFRSPAHSD